MTFEGLDEGWRSLDQFLREELKPFPGRSLAAGRIVIATTLTIILSETLRVPFPDFSAYVVFFVAGGDAAKSVKLGIAAMLAAALALAIAIATDTCFMDAPLFRVPASLLLVGVAVWLSRVLAVDAIGRLIAVVLALHLSLADTIFQPEILTRLTLWLWSVVGLAIGATIVVNHLLPDSSKRKAQKASQAKKLLAPGALSNGEHLIFAAKTTLAVGLCEILMNAAQWPGIRTCMITCVVTALATAESRSQKQTLRLAGATVGGLAGLAAVLFIVPNLDTIAGLLLLVASGTYAFAWVAVGSVRSSYAGLQMALAFYLLTLSGFTTSVDLTAIRDRFAGIILGLVAMWIVFHPTDSWVRPRQIPVR